MLVQPIQIIAVLEGRKGNDRRRRINPDYKAPKEQDADDPTVADEKLKAIDGVTRLLLHMGASVVSTPYCEADDTIAYLVSKLPGDHVVYTVDQDLLALGGP